MYIFTGRFRIEHFGAILFNVSGNMISVNKDCTRIIALINDGYGDMDVLTSEFKSLYEKELKKEVLEKFISRLIDEEFITEGNSVQAVHTAPLQFPNQRYENTISLVAPMMANIHLSYKCNQKCQFCYANASSNEERLPYSVDKWIESIQKLVEQGLIYINILGGEPLEYFDEMMTIFEKYDPFIHCSFATNATFAGGIKSCQAKRISQLKNKSMRVSIHGFKEGHDEVVGYPGAYEIAKKSLITLLNEGANPRVTVAVTRKLIPHIEDLLDDMRDTGVKYVEFSAIQYAGRALDNSESPPSFNELLKVKDFVDMYNEKSNGFITKAPFPYMDANTFQIGGKKLRCSITNGIDIDPHGDVYPCHLVLHDKNNFCLGNIFTDDVCNIWNHPIRERILTISSTDIKNSNCQNCNEIDQCVGGCKLASYKLYGNMYMGDPSCPQTSHNPNKTK